MHACALVGKRPGSAPGRGKLATREPLQFLQTAERYASAYTKNRQLEEKFPDSRDKFFLPCCFHSFCYARSAIPLAVCGIIIWYVALFLVLNGCIHHEFCAVCVELLLCHDYVPQSVRHLRVDACSASGPLRSAGLAYLPLDANGETYDYDKCVYFIVLL